MNLVKNIKNVLYYGSVILPIINNIYKAGKVIYELNKGNSEILQARKDITDGIKYIQSVLQEIKDFHRINDEEY